MINQMLKCFKRLDFSYGDTRQLFYLVEEVS